MLFVEIEVEALTTTETEKDFTSVHLFLKSYKSSFETAQFMRNYSTEMGHSLDLPEDRIGDCRPRPSNIAKPSSSFNPSWT